MVGVHIRNPASPTEPAVMVELQPSYSPQTQTALDSRICLMDKPSSSCSALPGRAQPSRPVHTAAALSGQGHQGHPASLLYSHRASQSRLFFFLPSCGFYKLSHQGDFIQVTFPSLKTNSLLFWLSQYT